MKLGLGLTLSDRVHETTEVQKAVQLLKKLASSPAGIFTVGQGYLQTPGNLLTYSNDLTNAVWLVNAGVTKTNATTASIGSSVSDTLYRIVAVTANAPNTWAMLISGTVGAQVKIRIEDGGAPFAGTEQIITLSATPTLYAVAHASTLTTVVVMLRSVGQACTVVSGGGGFFTGTLTASQILAMGGIPLTTAAAVAAVYTDAHVYQAGSTQVVYGADVAVDPSFDAPASWTVTQPTSGSASVSGGALRMNSADGSYSLVTVNTAMVTIGKTYSVTLDIESYTGSAGVGNVGGTLIPVTTGLVTVDWLASENVFSIKRATVCNIVIRGYTVREKITQSAAINSLLSNNYILSDGSTGYSAVDGPVGLVLDGAGSVGSELVTNGDFSNGLTGWSNISTGTGTATVSSGQLNLYRLNSSNAGKVLQTVGSSGNTYAVTFQIVSGTAFVSLAGAGGNYTTGTYSFLWVPSGSTLYIESVTDASTCVVDNISVKQVTGIHATQATTANKPTVRRGLLNLALYSNDFNNVAWANTVCTSTTVSTAPNGGATKKVVPDATPADHAFAKDATVTTATTYTIAFLAKASGYGFCAIGTVGAGVGYSFFNLNTGAVGTKLAAHTATEMVLTSSGFYLCVANVLTTATTLRHFALVTNTANTPSSTGNGVDGVEFAGYGIFQGTLTAQQILDAGGIPLTTSAAASNPNAGRYSWSFDGGDSLALGSVPFVSTDNSAVIVAMTPANATGWKDAFIVGSTGPSLVADIYDNNGTPGAAWRDDASGLVNLTGSSLGAVARVQSGRKVGNTRVLRVNGAQAATNTTALGVSTISGQVIGTSTQGVPTTYMSGNISIVIAIKGTLSDADMLTLERFAASTLPNAPSF